MAKPETVKCKTCDYMIDVDMLEECAFCAKVGWCPHCIADHEELCAEDDGEGGELSAYSK